MRALLAALLLCLATALAAAPSASASPGFRACTSPDPSEPGACVYILATSACAVARIDGPVLSACLDRSEPNVTACWDHDLLHNDNGTAFECTSVL
jgi:hypothetical protein